MQTVILLKDLKCTQCIRFNQFYICALPDPMKIDVDIMREITALAPEVEEMVRVTPISPLPTGGIPKVEDEDGRRSTEEKWKSKESLAGGHPPHPILPKWGHILVSGGRPHLGWTAPRKISVAHPLTVLVKDTRAKGAHLSTVTPQIIDSLPLDIFVATQLIGGHVLHHPTRDLSGVPEDSRVFPTSGVETLIKEEGPICRQVVAWSVGMSLDPSLCHTMGSTGLPGHRGAPGRCLGEAHVQRGIEANQFPKLGKMILEETRSWSILPVTDIIIISSAPAHVCSSQ